MARLLFAKVFWLWVAGYDDSFVYGFLRVVTPPITVSSLIDVTSLVHQEDTYEKLIFIYSRPLSRNAIAVESEASDSLTYRSSGFYA